MVEPHVGRDILPPVRVRGDVGASGLLEADAVGDLIDGHFEESAGRHGLAFAAEAGPSLTSREELTFAAEVVAAAPSQ